MVVVKVCGIRTKEAALKAAEAGADLIGLIFAKSKRQISAETAAEIVGALQSSSASPRRPSRLSLPPSGDGSRRDWFGSWAEVFCKATVPKRPLVVGVFSNQPVEEINSVVAMASLDLVQLHGNEPLDYASRISVPVIRAIHVGVDDTLETIRARVIPEHYAFILLDTKVDGTSQQGGSGVAFDWTLARTLGEVDGLPVLVAGGLTPDNVADAVQKTRPWGVDVSSGVETEGTKDLDKIEGFLVNAKGVVHVSE